MTATRTIEDYVNLERCVDALEDELVKLRKDAARYRWLRSWKRTADYKVSRWVAGEGRYDPLPQEGGLDAAIDADMALTPNAKVTGSPASSASPCGLPGSTPATNEERG
jgi:hypothetical protein